MHSKNARKLEIGTAVYIDLSRLGKSRGDYRKRPKTVLSGFVKHITPRGGVLVEIASWRDCVIEEAVPHGEKWATIQSIVVHGTDDGEPGPGQFVRRTPRAAPHDPGADFNPDAPLWPEGKE